MNKKILVLSPTPSHPQDAGNRKRIFALTKYLQELGATIYFVYCPREWDREIPQDAYDGMNQCWDYFFIAYPVQPAVHRTDSEYFYLDAWWDVGIEFTVNWIKLAANIDIVLCNYVFYSKVLTLFDSGITKVIDTHDIVSNRNYLLDRKLGYRDFFYVSPESEKEALDRAHLVLSIKDDESSWFKCLSKTPVLTIGHLEPKPSDIVKRNIDYKNIKLGFIGSANPINVRNLETFLDEYLALYAHYSESLNFIVGGKICDVLDTRFHDKIQIIGKVNEVSEFYNLVDVIVLPFEFSTGLKIKTVEALSWSKPCIGTINAFEGLGSNCKYHLFSTIKELAFGVKDIIQDSQSIIEQLQQDSESVFTNYTNSVKSSIEKLYKINWKSIKEIQLNQYLDSSPSIEDRPESEPTLYNFNLVTNIDFWNINDPHSLWINFFINNARKLGKLEIYRTKNFQDIKKDKLELYKLGLVDHVHCRELYQIIDLFRIDHEPNQVFINLLDFASIIINQDCLKELEHLDLVANHSLFYFFNKLAFDSDEIIRNNIYDVLKNDNSDSSFYIWDSKINLNLDEELAHIKPKNIYLPHNLIKFNHTKVEYDTTNLTEIVIATSYTDENNQVELNKLITYCQDFLPSHFRLVVFSDLLDITCANKHPINDVTNLISTIDIFICLEQPESISFLIYLCICNRIPVYAKTEEFVRDGIIKKIENLTSIPKSYQLFLEKSIFEQNNDKELIKQHNSWELFLQYWLNQTKNHSLVSGKKASEKFLV